MNRSPLFYPMRRGMDSDAGGAADLQTDVMRFMAILSLCLVAIFALVQSISPLQSDRTAPAKKAAEVPESKPLPTAVPVAVAQPEAVKTIEAQPAKQPPAAAKAPPPRPVVIREQVPDAAVAAPATQQQRAAPPRDEPREGFTLRFENDAALTQLVARNEVALYAITRQQALRIAMEYGQANFRAAALPDEYHEMDRNTVPDSIIGALRYSGHSAVAATWGVTLPSATSQRLNRFLNEYRGGELIIAADGSLRLEQ